MGLFEWFKKTTADGRIKRYIGEFKASSGKGKLQVQELEKSIDGQRSFRINLIRTTIASYQSLPIVLTESQIKELSKNIQETLETND